MPVLNIGGRRVTVGDEFLKLSPEEQSATVDEIASSMGDSFGQRYAALSGAPVVSDALREGMEAQAPRERGRQLALREGGVLDAVPIGLTSGMVGNLPDYPPAAIAGAKSFLRGGEFGQAYNDSLQEQRGIREGLSEKFPNTTLGAVFGGAVTPGFAAAKFINAPSFVGRLAQSTGIGGGLGFFQGLASGEGAEDRLSKGLFQGGMGAAFGAGGEAAISGAGKLIGRTFGGVKDAAPGVNAAERAAISDEFAVPLSRGQATGDVTQQAFEQAARNDARGATAGNIMRGFDEQQQQAVAAAKQGVADGLGGTVAPEDAGAIVQQGLKGRATQLHDASEAAYQRAGAKEANIAIDEVGRLGQKVADQLEANGIRLDTYGNYAGSQAAMNLLRRVAGFEGAPADGRVVAQSLQGLEQARKALIKVKPANGEDARALGYIRRAYDDWISDAVDRKLFSGDASALDDLKEARSLWSQYRGLTKGGKDDATPIIAKIATEERTGAEVANWLLGAAGAGQAGRSARVAVEVKRALGADSEAWEALRQAAWQKASNPARGTGPQAVSNSIMDFVRGNGAPLARVLFNSDEITKMTRMAALERFRVVDSRATNRGQSGYEIGRLLGGGATNVAAALSGAGASWATGDPKFLAIAALPLLRNVPSVSRAIAATKAEPSEFGQGVARSLRAGALTADDVKTKRLSISQQP